MPDGLEVTLFSANSAATRRKLLKPRSLTCGSMVVAERHRLSSAHGAMSQHLDSLYEGVLARLNRLNPLLARRAVSARRETVSSRFPASGPHHS